MAIRWQALEAFEVSPYRRKVLSNRLELLRNRWIPLVSENATPSSEKSALLLSPLELRASPGFAD